MTISGFAASFCYHPQAYWPQCIIHQGALSRLEAATGCKWRDETLKDAEACWQRLVELIRAGTPVQASWLEDIVFAGVIDSSNEFERRILALPTVDIIEDLWWDWSQFLSWYKQYSFNTIGYCEGKRPLQPEAVTVAQVLTKIIRLADADPRQTIPRIPEGTTWGLEGMKRFAEDIANLQHSGHPDEYFYEGWLGCHAIYPQISGRACIKAWLENLIARDALPITSADFLKKAATCYGHSLGCWRHWENHLGNPVMRPADGWTNPIHRQAGASCILQAIKHEEEALAALSQALLNL